MAKLQDDPKVQALLASAAAKATAAQTKAVKAETTRVLGALKTHVYNHTETHKAAGAKDAVKALAGLHKDVVATVKAPAAA